MLRIVACALLIGTSFCQDESGYYGFPVGEISHEASSTSGMLYLADPQTLIITNFTHMPEEDTGCYSIILGPAPTQGDAMKGEKMTKDGILLRYSPLNILRRKKRSTETSVEEEAAADNNRDKRQQARGRVVAAAPPPPPAVTPAAVDRVQMDSLIERAADEKAAGTGESSAREQEKEVTQQATHVAFALDTGRREHTKRRSSKRKEINGDVHSLEMIHDIESVENLDSSEDDFKKVLEDVNDEKLIVDKLPQDSESFEDSIEAEAIAMEKELKKVERLREKEKEKEKEAELSQIEDIMVVEPEISINSTLDAATNSTITEDAEEHDGISVVKEHAKRAVEHEVEGSGMEEAQKKKNPGRHDRLMKGGQKEEGMETEDEKKKGGNRGLHLGQEKKKNRLEEAMADKSENRTHTASARQAAENDLGDNNAKEDSEVEAGPFKPTEFSLPKLAEGRASFSLREHGKLSDFHWIGIYDQCTKKAYQLHEIAGNEIPDLESVSPLSGVAANVSSDSVQSHQRVRVLGKELDAILETVNGSDLVVKLPDGIRTFDVDFLMVFNEDTNRSYGHTFIPSLLVPPCDNL